MSADEKFFAWLDGELSSAEAAEMERRVAADPELQRLTEKHRALRARLADAFGSVAASAVPERLLEPLRAPEPRIVDLVAARARRKETAWRLLPQGLALAASLAAGVVVGTAIPSRSGDLVEGSGGQLYAASAVGSALNTQLASMPTNGGVRIGLTFRDEAGRICRSFAQGPTSGLACREGDRWAIRGLFASPEAATGGEYRMAAGTDPNLAALIEQTMSGEPLAALDEKAARDRGWR